MQMAGLHTFPSLASPPASRQRKRFSMCTKTTVLKFTLVMCLLSSGALADSMLTSEQIVAIFANAVRAGADRGLCIGTADSCKKETSTPAPTSVDMLVNFDLNSANLTP